jgi:hypothetical protein
MTGENSQHHFCLGKQISEVEEGPSGGSGQETYFLRQLWSEAVHNTFASFDSKHI